MRYIKYTGYNGFQVYGFVKDNSHKLDIWKVRLGRKLKLYSTGLSREIILVKGDYLYIDETKQYYLKIQHNSSFPIKQLFLSTIESIRKQLVKPKKEILETNSIIKEYLDGK